MAEGLYILIKKKKDLKDISVMVTIVIFRICTGTVVAFLCFKRISKRTFK